MKTNINIRMIIDDENNKVYLSVEGKVENAAPEDRTRLRDKLVEAFSHVLGLECETPQNNTDIVSGFKPVNEQEEKRIKEAVQSKSETPVEEIEEKKTTEKATEPEEQPVPAKEPVIPFGTFKGMTPSEILEEEGEAGIKKLKDIANTMNRNKNKHPENKNIINAVFISIINYKLSHNLPLEFKEMVWDIKRLSLENGDEDFSAVNTICQSFGETFQSLIRSQNQERMAEIYQRFLNAVRDSRSSL